MIEEIKIDSKINFVFWLTNELSMLTLNLNK